MIEEQRGKPSPPPPLSAIKIGSEYDPNRLLKVRLIRGGDSNRPRVIFNYERPVDVSERTYPTQRAIGGDLVITVAEARQFTALLTELCDQAEAS